MRPGSIGGSAAPTNLACSNGFGKYVITPRSATATDESWEGIVIAGVEARVRDWHLARRDSWPLIRGIRRPTDAVRASGLKPRDRLEAIAASPNGLVEEGAYRPSCASSMRRKLHALVAKGLTTTDALCTAIWIARALASTASRRHPFGEYELRHTNRVRWRDLRLSSIRARRPARNSDASAMIRLHTWSRCKARYSSATSACSPRLPGLQQRQEVAASAGSYVPRFAWHDSPKNFHQIGTSQCLQSAQT